MGLKRVTALCALMLGTAAATAAGGATGDGGRPAITGISHLAVYARDMKGADHFYRTTLGARRAEDPEAAGGVRYFINGDQFVELLPAPAGLGQSLLAHIAYKTSDAAALRRYLAAHGVADLSPLVSHGNERSFTARDPEGNSVEFVQGVAGGPVPGAIGARLLHVGMAVRDRAREDGFYRTLLGFRPYWYGAFQPDKVDWVSQQVPDGHEWLEYMMVGPTSDVTEDKVDARQLGVLNHVSIAVRNMEAAVTTLYAQDRLSPRHDGPQMGLDGKWQANLYDPDGTRVELMEYGPVMKPCCSAFTADSPTP
ncbi:VOC family protein [Sphingomonas morindae]|uniref:VOC family protein n=1 Tax=Sphingomonas morindae TaxID=1541170 RepID=A0ABY4X8N2_9SPHN|nr:VOC family protein [Sphingomonas morindae]USI73233.1 VOC family protein [Sphingomonas morindae]